MMVYGHTVGALLAQEFRVGLWHDVWLFQRGLTSSLFLLLAGFAFSIATSRHWAAHTQLSPTVMKRLRWFLLLILLGYALHFPVPRLADLAAASEERWRSFLAVDVLQLIGVTLLVLQALVLVTRTRRAFTVVAASLAVLVVFATPAVWSVDWMRHLPLSLAFYASPSEGSLFPIFPWAAFILIGAGAGQLYARWGATHLTAFTNRVLLVPGAMLVAGIVGASELALPRFGSSPWSWVPGEFLLRTGACFVLLGLIAHASRHIVRLPQVFGAVAQESLLIYFVHLGIVYGTIWNTGLRQFYAESLAPGLTALVVAAMFAAMTLFAWHWNRLKDVQPRAARWVCVAVGAALILLLV